jgi:geranylgeranyl pyrophosphate synthase
MKTARDIDNRPIFREPLRQPQFSKRQFLLRSMLEASSDEWLPDENVLRDLLGVRGSAAVSALLKSALLDPIRELSSTRGKRVRAEMVRLGSKVIEGRYESDLDSPDQWRICAEAIEFLHAGSLIIDDIEDGSTMRRGRPALHLRYGSALALNAGNWLYFWPLELLKCLDLPLAGRQLVYEQYHRTLLRAHFGQALDLGAGIDRIAKDQIEQVCLASMRLKTGALMGFALSLGSLVGGAGRSAAIILDEFGADFGVALQMFDDLGNVTGKCEPSKKFEDLILTRPSWVWASAARHTSDREFEMFIAAVRALPDDGELVSWFQRHGVLEKARRCANRFMESVFGSLQRSLSMAGLRGSTRTLEELRRLGHEVSVAYG